MLHKVNPFTVGKIMDIKKSCHECCSNHTNTLTASAYIQPIEFQNQRAIPIRILALKPVDQRPNPVSGSMAWIV